MKASDISDQRMIAIVEGLGGGGWPERPGSRWVMFGEVYRVLDDFPPKVVHAKGRQLIKRGLLHGCPCGCRGDLHLPCSGIC